MEDKHIDIQPRMGDSVVYIPVTFEHVATRKEDTTQRIIWSLVISILAIGISILMAIDDNKELIPKISGIFITLSVSLLIIRFIIIKERYYIGITKELESNDYVFDSRIYWHIYDTSEEYPYYTYYKNGDIALFVRLEKDVAVGMREENEYKHFEAVAEAYLRAGNSKIKIKYIDIMDSVGEDTRIDYLQSNLQRTKSRELRALYTAIFDSMSEILQKEYSSYDIYCFRLRGKEEELFSTTLDVIELLLQGNYISYTIMDNLEIRNLVEVLMNKEGFSVINANKLAKEVHSSRSITAIYTLDSQGNKKIYNKTTEEKIAEREVKEKERSLRKGKRTKINDFEISLDDEDNEI